MAEVEQEVKKEPETTKKVEKKPNNKSNQVNLFLLLLAIVLAVVLAYLYNNKKDEVSNLESKVTLLEQEKRLKDGFEAFADQIEPDIATDTVTTSNTGSCTGGSSFTAEVGKFSIDLDSPNVVIRNLDAGFEGGPATSLNVGVCDENEDNVFDNYLGSEVKVFANPNMTSVDLKTNQESQGITLQDEGTLTIDGVTANRYSFSGLFEQTLIYFDNNGIGYEIELADTNDVTNAILSDLLDDWKFTP